jgi:hypothetical protein
MKDDDEQWILAERVEERLSPRRAAPRVTGWQPQQP